MGMIRVGSRSAFSAHGPHRPVRAKLRYGRGPTLTARVSVLPSGCRTRSSIGSCAPEADRQGVARGWLLRGEAQTVDCQLKWHRLTTWGIPVVVQDDTAYMAPANIAT